MVKKVITINDLSGVGKCSLTVALPILSALGVQCCPVPTAVLSNQTEFDEFYLSDFTPHMVSIFEVWKKLNFEFEGIYTGYLANIKQIEVIKEVVKDFKGDNTIFVVDPVMGDNGSLYPGFKEDVKEGMTELAFLADIITPNLTEACILTNEKYEKLINFSTEEEMFVAIETLLKKLLKGNVKKIVITGIKFNNFFYNSIYENQQVTFLKRNVVGSNYPGTGDVLASIITGMSVKGYSLKESVELGSKFIEEAILSTSKTSTNVNYGVNFEEFLYMLTDINKNK